MRIDPVFVIPTESLPWAKSNGWRNGASHMDGCAASVAARELGDERVNLLLFLKY